MVAYGAYVYPSKFWFETLNSSFNCTPVGGDSEWPSSGHIYSSAMAYVLGIYAKLIDIDVYAVDCAL